MPTVIANIAGRRFELNAPYEAGHVLTEIEAKVLNQTWVENIRNNVKQKLDAGVFDEDDVLAYASTYTFAQRGFRAATEADPVEEEFQSQALEFIKEVLRRQGKTLKDRILEWSKGRFDGADQDKEIFRKARQAYLEETIEKVRQARPDIYEAARQAVEARKTARAVEAQVPMI